MLPITIIGASSLARAEADVRTSMSRFNLIAEPGMSFNNEDDVKNVYKVIKSRNWRQEQFVLWHDTVSNSLSQHPQQCAPPLSPDEFVDQLRQLARVNVIAIAYLPRKNAFSLDDKLWDIQEIMPYIKIRPLISGYFRGLLAENDLHLHFEIEEHLVRRFFQCNNLNDLMLYKRQNRNKCRRSKYN